MPIFCSKCNGANPIDGVKCWHCGNVLNGVPESSFQPKDDWATKQRLDTYTKDDIADVIDEQLERVLLQKMMQEAQAQQRYVPRDNTDYFNRYYEDSLRRETEINKILAEAEQKKRLEENNGCDQGVIWDVPMKDWADMNTEALRNRMYIMNLGNYYSTGSAVRK